MWSDILCSLFLFQWYPPYHLPRGILVVIVVSKPSPETLIYNTARKYAHKIGASKAISVPNHFTEKISFGNISRGAGGR